MMKECFSGSLGMLSTSVPSVQKLNLKNWLMSEKDMGHCWR